MSIVDLAVQNLVSPMVFFFALGLSVGSAALFVPLYAAVAARIEISLEAPD